MTSKWYCNREWPVQQTKKKLGFLLVMIAGVLTVPAMGGDAPQWMHARATTPLPAFDDKTDAVMLYSETTVNVQSTEKLKRTVREVYKILRPAGREYGSVVVPFNSHQKVNYLHGWCIPAQGKDFEIKDKDGMEMALPAVEGS